MKRSTLSSSFATYFSTILFHLHSLWMEGRLTNHCYTLLHLHFHHTNHISIRKQSSTPLHIHNRIRIIDSTAPSEHFRFMSSEFMPTVLIENS